MMKNAALIVAVLFSLSAAAYCQDITPKPIPGDPWGFLSRDFSGPEDNPNTVNGSAAYDPATETYTITANGEDMWDNDDGFRFTYLEVPAGTGDFELSVRVEMPQTWPDAWTKAGVMIRQGLDDLSDDAFMNIVASRSNGIVMQYRPTKHGAGTRTGGDAGKANFVNGSWNIAINEPIWLKITYEAATGICTGYYCYNGVDWLREPQAWRDSHSQYTLKFTQPFYVGICLTSHSAGAAGTAVFGDFRFPPLAGTRAVAGPDRWVYGNEEASLNASNSMKATTFQWTQVKVGTEPTVTIANPTQVIATFTPPGTEIGYTLKFELTVTGETGTSTDDILYFVRAVNPPKVAPGNVRAKPMDVNGELGFTLEWDPVLDATQYQIALKLGTEYFWTYTTANTYYPIMGMTEGMTRTVAVRGENKYSVPLSSDPTKHGVPSGDIAYTAMANISRLAGTTPPTGYLSSVLPSPIAGLNNGQTTDSVDSNNAQPKTEDYWGYLWDDVLLFNHIVYYTGQSSSNGGWFTSLKVQYSPDGTTWKDATGLTITPAYDFTNSPAGRLRSTRYDISFLTVRGKGLRIFGAPGGSATQQYTSVAELETFGNQLGEPLVVYGVDGTFNERATALLDGSNSFSTRGNLSGFQWVQTGGPNVTIAGANLALATFSAPGVDADTLLTFQFTAGDGSETKTDDVTITVKNLVTTAVAGPDRSVPEGSPVTLNGTGSVTTSGTLTYSWTQTAGTTVVLTGANTAAPSFTAPILWDYNENFVFQLEVNDGVGGISTDSITVNVKNIIEDGVLIDPLGLSARDISGTEDNPNNVPGASSYDPYTQTYTVSGDGEDIWDNDDGFRFVYKEVGSDFSSISVRIDNPPATWPNAWTKVGLMARQDLDADSVYMDLVASLSNGMVQQYRTTKHGGAARVAGNQPFVNGSLTFTGPVWLKLERQGDLWVGYYSFDGADWVVGSLWNFPTQHTIPIAAPYYVGICVTSHDGGALATAKLGELKEKAAFVLTDAYAVRNLPASCEVGGTMDVALTLKVNPNNKPTTVTISEQIPAGLSEDDVVAPGAVVSAGKITWTLTGTDVKTGAIAYSLSIPEETTQALDFAGAVSFGTTTADIIGENLVYAVPTEPRYLEVEMLAAAHLSWSPPATEGVAGYRIERSVNGGAWEDLAMTTGTSFVDSAVTAGNNYSYRIAAANVRGIEGSSSDPTDQALLPTMLIREAEDFNYGGGLYPWVTGTTTAATEALSASAVECTNDFWQPNKGGPRTYRPLDAIGIETVLDDGTTDVYHTNIGWIDVGAWWKYTFNVTQAGWVKLDLRVAAPGSSTMAAYWDDQLIGTTPSFATGSWHTLTWATLEDQIQTTTGVHTLRVQSVAGGMNFDKIAIGFNWAAPKRKAIWSDNFDAYSTTAEVKATGGWNIVDGSSPTDPNAAWQLWDTENDLGSNPGNLEGMNDKYMISNSDFAPSSEMDEELISPEVDCTNYVKIRLNFNKNFRVYPTDSEDDPQVGEVDIRVYDVATGWSDWVNLLHFDKSLFNPADDPAQDATPEQLDLSAYDGKKVQLRWHYFNAFFDYWFAIDEVKVSGLSLPPTKGKITGVVLAAGKVALTWTAFGPGQYTVQYTDNLVGGTWTSVAGMPTTATTWAGEDIAGIPGKRYYRVMAPSQ